MIEAAHPAHALALAGIHAASFPAGARWGADAMILQLGLPGVFGLIDGRGGMVLARVVADEAEILTLAVLPEARRQGLARTLLQAAMQRAAGAGAGAMLLEAGRSNSAALALYASLGFMQAGLRRGYYGEGEDALILRAPLGSGRTVTLAS